MTRPHKDAAEAACQFAEAGGKGFAGRQATGQRPAPPQEDGAVRKALQRVGKGAGRAARSPEGEEGAMPQSPDRRAAVAAQAVLGILGGDLGQGGGVEVNSLRDRLSELSPQDLDRLGKLVKAAQAGQGKAAEGGAPLGKLAGQLAERGINLDFDANNVTVNIGSEITTAPYQRGGSRQPPQRGFPSRGGLGYQFGRVKDFLLGR